MKRTMLKSKIHRATVTDADLEYVGSITLDPVLIEAAELMVYELVHVYNITNGERFSTYVIEGERGAGEVVLNGAAAHRVSAGDLVILCSYAEYDSEELKTHEPQVIFVDGENRIVDKATAIKAGQGPLPLPAAV
ncbi:MAG: aspartate 1-decarboxylase [Thermoanaerobaculia bacterium]|nr:aspartate 1-decarboxylase [Thermoanaerobaculia bacterium]